MSTRPQMIIIFLYFAPYLGITKASELKFIP